MSHPLLFGDNLFETVRVIQGQAQRLERHQARFTAAAKALGYPVVEINQGVAALDSLNGRDDGLWRVTFVRGADLFGDWEPDILFHHRPITQRSRPRLTLVDGYLPDDTMAEFKTTSYLRSMTARRAAIKAGFDDGLMVSRAKTLGEASMANVFLVLGDSLVTPTIEGILPGTTRAAILENARDAGIRIAQKTIHHDEVLQASEIILTSAGVLALSALSLDGRKLGEHWGPILARFACV